MGEFQAAIDGIYTITIQASDFAGNLLEFKLIITIDTTQPEIFVISPKIFNTLLSNIFSHNLLNILNRG